jgi:hypothetical protein
MTVPPVAAFLSAEILLYVAASLNGSTSDFFSPSHWSRYDSGIYLHIAQHGFSLMHCPANGAYPPHTWCGTAGWAPLYPGLTWFLGHVGFALPTAAMVVSALFAYLTLQAVWVLIGPAWTFRSLCCLALAAFFPGMIYYYAEYPISLFACLATVCVIAFIRRRFLLAGVMGALCTWAFAVGPLVGIVLVVAALILERGPRLWRVLAQTAGVTFAGFAALLLANQWWVGSWKAYFQIQAKYDNGLHDPVKVFVGSFTGVGHLTTYPILGANPAYNYLAPQAQTAFVAALVLGLVAWTLWRRPVSRADVVVLSYTVVFWFLPLVDGPTLGRYRLEALLVPCVALCTRLPRFVLVALVGASAVIAVGLTSLFTQRVLF